MISAEHQFFEISQLVPYSSDSDTWLQVLPVQRPRSHSDLSVSSCTSDKSSSSSCELGTLEVDTPDLTPDLTPDYAVVPSHSPRSVTDQYYSELTVMESGWTTPGDLKVEQDNTPHLETTQDALLKLDHLRHLALQEAVRDIDMACDILRIDPDPYEWSVDNVQSWLEWTSSQYTLPHFNMNNFRMSGSYLASLEESDFCTLAPSCGKTLYAQLDIWITGAKQQRLETRSSAGQTVLTNMENLMDMSRIVSSPHSQSSGCSSLSAQEPLAVKLEPHDTLVMSPSALVMSPSALSHSSSEGETVSEPTRSPRRAPGTGRNQISLWRFLKELLERPEHYHAAIRWLDQQQGIFKIEDSVTVAKLWGKRKNRPAMNYDKLSRSLRQYYKKGILKKTERSQRLVYQFCS